MADQADSEEGVAEKSADVAAGGDRPSWVVLAEKRAQRAHLDREIARDSRQAILDSRKAGVSTTDLAALWGVTLTWIYTQAPVRKKTGRQGR